MSFKLMGEALSIKTGSCITKMVLLKLCDNSNDAGECWPSYQTIADHCEISKTTAKAHIKKLIAMGLVSKTERKLSSKKNTSNMYKISLFSGAANNPYGAAPDPSSGAAPAPKPIRPLEPISERELTFKELVKKTWTDLGGESFLPNIEAQKFFLHFSESNGTKMAFEKCKTFDIRKRMHKWKLNGYSKTTYSEGRNNA
jgi:hypothetical protein